MGFTITTNHVLKVLQVLSWIIFIGLSVEAGGIIVNTIITLFINPAGVDNFWEGAALPGVYKFDRGHFIVITLVMIIVAVLKATMFYIIVKLFTDKTLSMSHPFNAALRGFILKLSYLAFGIGLFSHSGAEYCARLAKQGSEPVDLQTLHIAGSGVWLFMAVVLFVIAQIVKRGIEIQAENDLTI